MEKNTRVYEAYLRSRISTSKCVLEQVILHAHRLNEAVLGSHYKASLFFGPDDVKFLQQFPRKHCEHLAKQLEQDILRQSL